MYRPKRLTNNAYTLKNIKKTHQTNQKDPKTWPMLFFKTNSTIADFKTEPVVGLMTTYTLYNILSEDQKQFFL